MEALDWFPGAFGLGVILPLHKEFILRIGVVLRGSLSKDFLNNVLVVGSIVERWLGVRVVWSVIVFRRFDVTLELADVEHVVDVLEAFRECELVGEVIDGLDVLILARVGGSQDGADANGVFVNEINSLLGVKDIAFSGAIDILR